MSVVIARSYSRISGQISVEVATKRPGGQELGARGLDQLLV